MTQPINPIRDLDPEARALAHDLIAGARHASLGTIDPDTGFPMVTRIALGTDPNGNLYTFVSGLSVHSRALRADPRASLLIGEPGAKGDPLTHPRLSLRANATLIPPSAPRTGALRAWWLASHPKSKIYIDLPDFFFVRFEPQDAMLNGGFARAYRLEAEDLRA